MDGLSFCTVIGVAADEDISLYGMDLDAQPDDAIVAFERSLDPPERLQVARIAIPEQRRRLVASRGALRMIVGARLRRRAAEVAITRDARGKPSASAQGIPDRLSVSCSRSGRFAVIGVSNRHDIGIDIEALTEERFPDSLCEFILSPSELESYPDLDPRERTAWLARAWVRKEALLKGLGCGLEIEPSAISTAADENQTRSHNPCGCIFYNALGFTGWRLKDALWRDSAIGVASQARPASRL